MWRVTSQKILKLAWLALMCLSLCQWRIIALVAGSHLFLVSIICMGWKVFVSIHASKPQPQDGHQVCALTRNSRCQLWVSVKSDKKNKPARDGRLFFDPTDVFYDSSGKSLKWASASGLSSAPTLAISLPCTTSRTASSVILPDFVRGISATFRITDGTWRGVALLRICVLMRSFRSSSSTAPSRNFTNKTTHVDHFSNLGQ